MNASSEMQIDIPSSDQQKLANQAAATGFSSVEAFASDLLASYANLAVDPSDEAALRESLSGLEASRRDKAAGNSQDARDAIREIAQSYGLEVDR